VTSADPDQSSRRRSSSFRFRVAIAIVLLVSVTLSVAAVAMWGVVRIHEDSQVALRGYRQLRDVYEVGVYVTQARQSLRRGGSGFFRGPAERGVCAGSAGSIHGE
jgi:hypothetical protein